MNHCVTTNPDISINFPSFSFLQVEGYIFKEQIPETVPLYEYYNDIVFDHYRTNKDLNYIRQGIFSRMWTENKVWIDNNSNGEMLLTLFSVEMKQ